MSKPKKIKLRIALAINVNGEWFATGSHAHESVSWDHHMETFDQLSNEQRRWIEVEFDLGTLVEQTIPGEVIPAK